MSRTFWLGMFLGVMIGVNGFMGGWSFARGDDVFMLANLGVVFASFVWLGVLWMADVNLGSRGKR